MQDKKYGEFNNFDDFLNDLLSDMDDLSFSKTEEAEDDDTASSDASKIDRHPAQDAPQGRLKAGAMSSRKEDHLTHSAKHSKASKHRIGQSGLFFFAALFAVTAIAWDLPLRPTVSETEKRNLEIFPEFSVTELIHGDYFKSIESWFADTFTFRDKWMSASEKLKKSFGINDVMIIGDVPVADSIPIPAPVDHRDGESVITEINDTKTAESEQPHAAAPFDDGESASDADTSSASASEEPENAGEWGGMVVDDELIADKGGKLMIGDSVFLYPGFNEYYARQYAELMNKASDLLEGKANFYCLLVPENVTSMLTREDREKYGFVIEEDAFDFMYSLMDSNVHKVNIIENLQKHNDEYITFRTDHHWTAVGAFYAYEEWCRVAGKTPVPLSEYEEIIWEDFYGTYYYTSGEPKNLRDNPDDVHAFVPPGDVHLYLDFSNTDRLGEEYDLLLDRSTRKVDQYITFLTSDRAKATLVNESIDDDSACVVMKNSFGNPFVYYLTQHYHTVYVLDLRCYGYHGIVDFCDTFDVSDVILIHSPDLCYSKTTMSVVKSLIK